MEIDETGASHRTAKKGSLSDSYSEKEGDDNSYDDAVSDLEMVQLLETDTVGTSDKIANSGSSSDSLGEEGNENNISEEDDVSDSEEFQLLKDDISISLRGGGSERGGTNPSDLESNLGPSQERRRSSLVTPTFRYDRQKPENLFPPTKKYRYYPVTCENCGKRFQPNKLKAHQRKHHLSENQEEVKPPKKAQSAPPSRKQANKPSTSRSKSAGGIPRQLQVCYICGQLYGSRSLKIHEPKCLDKWRIQNQQLPPDLRAPEPVKPEAMTPG